MLGQGQMGPVPTLWPCLVPCCLHTVALTPSSWVVHPESSVWELVNVTSTVWSLVSYVVCFLWFKCQKQGECVVRVCSYPRNGDKSVVTKVLASFCIWWFSPCPGLPSFLVLCAYDFSIRIWANWRQGQSVFIHLWILPHYCLIGAYCLNKLVNKCSLHV